MKHIGIIMNGVTGRMGTRQHLERSIAAIRQQGGITLPGGETLMPDPILVGRNENKLQTLAETYHIDKWTTKLDECLTDPYYEIYFDSQTTTRRPEAIEKAIKHGKHIYCEKPSAVSTEDALHLARLAHEHGVKHGIVQDKLFLPGLLKLKRLIDHGFLAKSSLFAENSAIGYLKEIGRPANARPGITARKTAGVLLWICSVTGNTSSATYSGRLTPYPVTVPLTLKNGGMKQANLTTPPLMTPLMPCLKSKMILWHKSIPLGVCV